MILLALLACGTADQVAMEAVARNPMGQIDRDVDLSAAQAGVAEHVDAGGYMYLRTDETPPRWVVGLAKAVEVGDRVEIRPVGVARDFESARTGMVFDELWFAVIE